MAKILYINNVKCMNAESRENLTIIAIKRVLVVVLCAVVACACSESSDEDNPQCNSETGSCEPTGEAECTNNTWTCQGNTLSKCVSEKWEISQTCPENTKCNADTGTCEKIENPKNTCQNTEHFFANKCEPDDITHCGTHTNDCTKLSGWKSGDCIGKTCFAEECHSGYHLVSLFDDDNNEITSCEEDTHDACGSINTKCGAEELCIQGECKEKCQPGEVSCGGACINPQTSKNFCGADASCSSFIPCSEFEDCISGKCVLSSCQNEEESICKENNQNICVNIHDSNPNHCGACGAICSDKGTAKANGCNQGQCVYTCNDTMVNCGSETEPMCLPEDQLKSDPQHCGSCEKKCADNEFCQDGKCAVNSCIDNACRFDNACVNQDDHCGSQCLNCNMANLASSGTCQDGSCIITSCVAGFHLTSKGVCEIDSATACPNGNTTGTVDCNTVDAYTKAGICVEANCQATECQQNAHLKDGKCIADTPEKCGISEINCTENAGWQSGACAKGICIATTCKSGYCLNQISRQCTNEQSSSACGIDGGACQACNSKQVCSAGTCEAKLCEGNICNQTKVSDATLVCKNDDTHCGSDCQNCNTFTSHAISGLCLSNGTCQVTECASGYHLYNNACEADSVTNCGKHDIQCNIENANNECKNKVCAFTCKSNYHIYNNACEADSLENCGKHGTQCNLVENANNECKNNVCTFTCESNFHTYNDACEADSLENCGSHGAQCNLVAYANNKCENKTCTFKCIDGYEQSGGKCVADFVSIWDLTSGDLTINFPIQGRDGTLIIDWGDGKSDTISSGTSDNIAHTYSSAKFYTITVKGMINQWSCSGSLCKQLVSIQSYGETTFGANAFSNAEQLISLPTKVTPRFNNSMYGTFRGASKFNQNINFWDTSNVTNMSEMFMNATSFNQPLDKWNTEKVTSMQEMFRGATNFNQPLNNWNTSMVKNMSRMFYGATSFNQPLNNWNTERVTSMSDMFSGATNFDQPLNNWNTSNVTHMRQMFRGATNFDQQLNNWNTSKVTDMSYMFYGATSFNQSLNNWNTSKVTDMSYMFYGATSFNQSLNNWNTTRVNYMQNMFRDATSFNQPLNTWDTKRVISVSGMFYGATSFDQPLDKWNPENIEKMDDIFQNSGLQKDNYCKLFNSAYASIWNKFKSVFGISYSCP